MKRLFAILIFSLVSFRGIAANAEYRVYVLEIASEDGKSRSVTTTLDPWQYPHLNPLKKGETVQYTDSWMCWENTSNRPPCAKLETQAASPASTDAKPSSDPTPSKNPS